MLCNFHISCICINLNRYLHFSSGLVSFKGLCRDGSNDWNYIGEAVSKGLGDCQQRCLESNQGCTAVVYNEESAPINEYVNQPAKTCIAYGGGPYTNGDGMEGFKCYVMPGIHISCRICKVNFVNIMFVLWICVKYTTVFFSLQQHVRMA